MPKHIELSPGEVFMVADRTILVREYESVLANLSLIDGSNEQTAYLMTFTGRVNKTQDEDSVTISMSPEDTYVLVSDLLNGLELLSQMAKDQNNDS